MTSWQTKAVISWWSLLLNSLWNDSEVTWDSLTYGWDATTERLWETLLNSIWWMLLLNALWDDNIVTWDNVVYPWDATSKNWKNKKNTTWYT